MKLSSRISVYILVAFLITLFLRIMLISCYDNNLGGIEPNVIYGIQRVLMGEPLYQHTTSGSFAIMQYTPLWYYFVAGVARLISNTNYQGGLDVQGLYELSRILALFFNLLSICVCMLIFRLQGFSFRSALVWSLPLFIILTNHYYTRGDSMQLFLFIAATYCFVAYSKKRAVAFLIGAIICTAACITTKQNGILCMGIIGFCLFFLERKYLSAIIYAVLSVLLSWAIIRWCIGSDWSTFYENAWLGLKSGIDLSFLYRMFISQFFMDLVPFYILGCILAWLAIKKTKAPGLHIPAAGAGLSFLFAIITGIKVGSSNNYFTEFLFFVLLALPQLLRQEQSKVFGKITVRAYTLIVFIILITSKTVGFFSVVFVEKGIKNYRQEYANEQKLFQYFTDSLHLQPTDKIFFTERRFLDNLFIRYAIMPNKDVTTQVYNANHSTYDYSSFTSGMNNGPVKYIVTLESRDDINICSDSLPFVNFDKTKFSFVARKYGYCIYAWMPPKNIL